MEISDIDKNLKVDTNITEPDLVWFDAKEAPFVLSGVFYDAAEGRYLRMPMDIARTVSTGVAGLIKCTAGGRVRFCTDSSFIAIRAVMANSNPMCHMPLTGQSGFDIYRQNGDKDRYFHTFVPPRGMSQGYSASYRTDSGLWQYTLNFPLYDGVKELYIALKKNAHIYAPAEYLHKKPIVYYGSSITQGGCASRPGNSYQAILSRRLDTEYINLGFSGCCRGEATMADYLCGLDMSVFVSDYDHNANSPEELRNTLFPLYEKMRAAHPDLPMIFISAPDSLLKGDDTPWNEAYTTRRNIVRELVDKAKAAGDCRIVFVDGAMLFAGEEWDACTVDGCHPNDLGFYRMAMRIEPALKKFLTE